MQIIEIRDANGRIITINNVPIGIAHSSHDHLWLVAPTTFDETAEDVERFTASARLELTPGAGSASNNGRHRPPEAPD